jgi:hypothetical protein
MARYSDLHGLQAALRHCTSKLGHNVSYTIVYNPEHIRYRYRYRKKLTIAKDSVVSLPHERRGRPFLLPVNINLRVQKQFAKQVNRKVAIATVIGTVRVPCSPPYFWMPYK